MGRGIRVVGSNYTSQLNISVSSDMIGKTILCVYDNYLDTEEVVGTLILTKAGKISHIFHDCIIKILFRHPTHCSSVKLILY